MEGTKAAPHPLSQCMQKAKLASAHREEAALSEKCLPRSDLILFTASTAGPSGDSVPKPSCRHELSRACILAPSHSPVGRGN